MKRRNIIISIFVIVWVILFNYESTRAFFLQPLFKKPFPKMKFLFPPAGWIMFFNVDSSFRYVQVYGMKKGISQAIDAHQILQTRDIGYDNIHRNVLGAVLSQDMVKPFCVFLERKFPYFDSFVVTYVNYPSLDSEPMKQEQNVAYQCL